MNPNNRLSANLYTYCYNNPVIYVDYDGRSAKNITRTLAYMLIGNPINALITQYPGWLTLALFYKAGFIRDSRGVYHARQDCWQRIGGYNDFYDVVFNYATSMKSQKFNFTYGRTSYIFWAWKGNYLNLGAGAEMGIYYGGGPHWFVNTKLAIPMSLTLRYKGRTIISYSANAWWITGFNPYYQGVKYSDLTASYTVTFTNQGMYNAFMGIWNGHGCKPAGGLSATYTF